MARVSRSRVWVGSQSQSPRSAWLAVNLSAVMPGLGQLYGGAWVKAGAIALSSVLLPWLIYREIFTPDGNTLSGLMLLLPLGALYLGGLWDSHRTVAAFHSIAPTQQDPWYPVFLSHVLPGIGQLYQQQAFWGGLFLLLGISTAYAANFQPALLPLASLIWAIACAHAYLSDAAPKQLGILAVFLAGLVALRLAIGAIPAWVQATFEQCIVPSESMEPTLMVDDFILVARDSAYEPQPQDIVVFQAPDEAISAGALDPGDLAVKRIIGLPGQQVSIRNGQVWVNGATLAEGYVREAPTYEWGPETVPGGQLFVLGDNRNYSADSHVWGFLPQRLLVGKAQKIYWPPPRIRSLE